MSRFSLKIVLSHSTESIRRETLLCFRDFRVSKNFLDKRREKGGGKITRSCLNFCLALPKIFVQENSVFQKISGIKKF